MKVFFEDPVLRVVLFDLDDVLTVSEPENPDDNGTGNDTPIISTP